MRTGTKHNLETKKKISEALKGRLKSPKAYKFPKGSKINLGKKATEETKKKLSKTHKGLIPWNKGKKITEEHKKNISKGLKGIPKPKGFGEKLSKEKHWNWQGGKSFEPYSIDWTETLKRAIRERDKYICQLCSQYGKDVHHIDYNKKNCNPDNLITLCRECNVKVNFNRKYWTEYFYKIK